MRIERVEEVPHMSRINLPPPEVKPLEFSVPGNDEVKMYLSCKKGQTVTAEFQKNLSVIGRVSATRPQGARSISTQVATATLDLNSTNQEISYKGCSSRIENSSGSLQ